MTLTPGDVAAALNGNRPVSQPAPPLTPLQQRQLDALRITWLEDLKRGGQ